jgi:hypothetical protein
MKIVRTYPFWVWLCRFAYRRIKVGMHKKPIGLPGNRDPENICEAYSPRRPLKSDFGADCETDGHYLCKECALRGLEPKDNN